MAYGDFDLATARQRFGLRRVEDTDLFADVAEVQASEWLLESLRIGSPIALAISTEKARSEMIVTPILLEAVRRAEAPVHLFSGVNFDVDRDRGLNGPCDFIFSRSIERFFIDKPVVAVAEAKRDDMHAGLGQCVAAMYAAQVFNAREEGATPRLIFGLVTTGSLWRFLRLEGDAIHIDLPEYTLDRLPKILGILLHIVK